MKLVYGFGINDADYKVETKDSEGNKQLCPYYIRWVSMIQRCYSDAYKKKHPTYEGCFVSDKWRKFMTFRRWMETQDWQGKHLDKDIKVIGNKEYSEETCMFISSRLNLLFLKGKMNKRGLPTGVTINRYGKFEVGCSIGKSKRIHLGYFDSLDDAVEAYILAKWESVRLVLEMEPIENHAYIKAYAKMYFSKIYETLRKCQTYALKQTIYASA